MAPLWRELGVQLDDVADIDHHQEGRPALVGRQGAGVVLGLGAGAQQGVVETACAADLELLRFQHEGAAAVAVDAAFGAAAVAVAEDDAALEDVGVVAGVVLRRFGRLDAEQTAQFAHETLGIGQLGARCGTPAGDE